MASWWRRTGGNLLGSLTGGLAGNEKFGYMDEAARVGGRAKEGIGDAWNDLTGVTGAREARRAAEIQKQGADEATALQREMYGQGREDMLPWLESGQANLATLQGLMGQDGFDVDVPDFQDFDASQYDIPDEFSFRDFDFEADPGYQFRQDEARKGLERSAASRGGLASGATLAGLMDRSQDVASDEYGRAHARYGQDYNRALGTYGTNLNRALGERDFGYGQYQDKYGRTMDRYGQQVGRQADRYNRLANLAGMGQTQSQSLGSLGAGFGRSAGQNIMGGANALAAGRIGAANARSQGMSNLMNLGMQGASLYMMSDKRLKRNISKIGKFKDYTKYLYQYLWSDEWFMGVMSDEVKKINPKAVINVDGFDAVNYGVL